jgi:predicted small secreted protein
MKPIVALFAAAVVLFLSACNTVQGVGQDIQKGGQVLEDAAKKK